VILGKRNFAHQHAVRPIADRLQSGVSQTNRQLASSHGQNGVRRRRQKRLVPSKHLINSIEKKNYWRIISGRSPFTCS